MTASEQRTLRIAAIGISIYLVLFFGFRMVKHSRASVPDYDQLVRTSQQIELEIDRYETKKALLEKLRETYGVSVTNVNRASLVADASSAIQNAATAGGVLLGPIRESPGRNSVKELAAVQLEGVGPVPSITTFLYRLNTLGYPLVIDSIQITPDNTKPGMVKLNLTIVILDLEQWKKEGTPNV